MPAVTNDDYGMQVGSGFVFQCGLGPDLIPATGTITITDSLHFLTGSGAITTIAWGANNSPANPSLVLFLRRAGQTCTFAAGGNILGDIPQVTDLDPILAVWDGANSWYLLSTALAPKVSTLASAVGNGETIATAGLKVARYSTNGSARTGVILQAGTYDGQEVTVINEDTTAAHSITFAAVATSHVANGVTTVINGLTQRIFRWSANAATPAWFTT